MFCFVFFKYCTFFKINKPNKSPSFLWNSRDQFPASQSVEEPWKWHHCHLDLVFQKHLNTRGSLVLTALTGLWNSGHVRGNFWEEMVLSISLNSKSSNLYNLKSTAGCSAVRCFQENQHWWLHLCPAINSNRPVSRLDYNQLFKQKKFTFQCKENNLSIVCFFSRRCNNTSSMTEVVAYWKIKQLMSNSSTDIYKG